MRRDRSRRILPKPNSRYACFFLLPQLFYLVFFSDEQVYELDGLKSGPILLGEYGSGGDWLSVAGPAITSRIQRYASSEIRFNLMGIVKVKRAGACAFLVALPRPPAQLYLDLQTAPRNACACFRSLSFKDRLLVAFPWLLLTCVLRTPSLFFSLSSTPRRTRSRCTKKR